METAITNEMAAEFYQATRRYKPEDSRLHTPRRQNFKSQ
jgi:hypothetical protein